MSECVVRMEMPQSCWVCPFGIDGYLWNENDARTYHVRLCSQHSGVEYRVLKTDDSDRPWYCDSFICQLPEWHGRLVEEKQVRWAIDDIVLEIANRTGRVGMTKDETMEYINNLCTIVPAERSET